MNRRNPAAIERQQFYIRTAGAILGAFFLIWAFSSCATISPQDLKSLDNLAWCKSEALFLMNKATTPYSSNTAVIEKVFVDVNHAYDYDVNRPLNLITVEMWNLLRDPNRDTYAGFLAMWKKRGTLPQGYIDQQKLTTGYAFDRMMQLESGKIKQ
jgi:hypothetical protein